MIPIDTSHPFFSNPISTEKLTKPLFKHTSFDYFDYEKYEYNGFFAVTQQDPVVAAEVFRSGLFPSLEMLHSNLSHYYSLSIVNKLKDIDDKNQDFLLQNIELVYRYDIYHRLCLVFKYPEYVEIFTFGIRYPVKNIAEIFINEAPVLEQFCGYFRQAGVKIIQELSEQRICFDSSEPDDYFQSKPIREDAKYQAFLKDIQLHQHEVKGRNGRAKLSAREFKCLSWSCQNKTAKQIAKILSLSPRTVETYLEKLKEKLGCSSKIELVQVGLNHPIIKDYFS